MKEIKDRYKPVTDEIYLLFTTFDVETKDAALF